MWKVKRMNTARIVVLAIAIGAGGIAAYLVKNGDDLTEALSRLASGVGPRAIPIR